MIFRRRVIVIFMKKLPKSLRKHIRREKARIRKELEGKEEQEKKIEELYKKIQKTKKDYTLTKCA